MLNNIKNKINISSTQKYLRINTYTDKYNNLSKSISESFYIKNKQISFTTNNYNNFISFHKKAFADKLSSEDLIEQILLNKANNGKKTFVAQEKAHSIDGIYNKNNNNNTIGTNYSQNYNTKNVNNNNIGKSNYKIKTK